MEKLKIDEGYLEESALRRAVEWLVEGRVVLHATETCYGLAADIFNEDALARVYELKNMDRGKPVSVMVSSLDEAKKYGDFSEDALALAQRFWPGPLTIIVPRKPNLPEFFNKETDSVGIRCPDYDIVRRLVGGFGGVLTTTSANISNLPQAYTVEQFLSQHDGRDAGAGLDGNLLVLDSGKIPERKPSTIINMCGEEPVIVREGDMIDEVKSFLDGK